MSNKSRAFRNADPARVYVHCADLQRQEELADPLTYEEQLAYRQLRLEMQAAQLATYLPKQRNPRQEMLDKMDKMLGKLDTIADRLQSLSYRLR